MASNHYDPYTNHCWKTKVKCVAWSPGGEFMATCSRDKSVWLWDVDYQDDEYMCASVLHSHTQVKKIP